LGSRGSDERNQSSTTPFTGFALHRIAVATHWTEHATAPRRQYIATLATELVSIWIGSTTLWTMDHQTLSPASPKGQDSTVLTNRYIDQKWTRHKRHTD
jgi:hypothetical protein